MKTLTILFLSVLLCSCAETTPEHSSTGENSSSTMDILSNTIHADTLSWIDNFKQFRDAVYTRNKLKVKSFMDFPVMNENNEIWYLVYEGNEKAINLLTAETKPFTERDFDLYFDKLFSEGFVKTILKIKAGELYENSKSETVRLEDGKGTTHYMIVNFDKATNTLTLNLASETYETDTKGEALDKAEFNVMYYFRIAKDGQLKFDHVRLAG